MFSSLAASTHAYRCDPNPFSFKTKAASVHIYYLLVFSILNFLASRLKSILRSRAEMALAYFSGLFAVFCFLFIFYDFLVEN